LQAAATKRTKREVEKENITANLDNLENCVEENLLFKSELSSAGQNPVSCRRILQDWETPDGLYRNCRYLSMSYW